ncbi:MAG: Hpt domain-containing protein [Gemmatimonadetes bacterium]|nr:Hpt domain-containing protein [Gemmatimonadota bacterium]
MEEVTLGVRAPLDLEGFRNSMQAAGIEEIVEPTLQLFVEESAGLMAALEESLAASDAESLRKAAHKLKGSSGNVHARHLSELAEGLEHIARGGDLSTAPRLVAQTRREYGAVREFLARQGVA